MESLINIGEEIREERLHFGMSQEELSQICMIDRAQLSRIEQGEVPGVTYATIEKILNAFGKKLATKEIKPIPKLELHPFVKWAGGKTQLMSQIEFHMPNKFNRYFEPFVGGGALLFEIQPKAFSINDLNPELICAYRCFENDRVFEQLKSLLIKHEENHSEKYYYEVRDEDKNDLFEAFPPVERAARMIYLNKACFNGLYRVNSKGYFNVPFGKKDKVICFDRNNFEQLKAFFKNTKHVVTNIDFEDAVKNARSGDFVYFDPPYDTWDEKESFTSYSKDEFGKKEQIRLARVYKTLSDRGVLVMLSNHNTKFIQELYKDFRINVVSAKRMINSNGSGRGEVEEVIVTNYE